MAKKPKKEPEGQFTIKLENPRILKAIIETLASIIDETMILITPEEFKIKAMDPSRICLMQLVIKKEDFDEFECTKECKIGLNLDDFDKIMKRSSNNDIITLEFKEEDQKIGIKMKQNDSTKTRTFSLALLDIDIEDVPLDNLINIEYDTSWKMDLVFLNEAIKDAEIYSEVFNIKTTKDEGLVFSSSGQIGEMLYELSLDDLIEHDIPGESKGAYSITFLKSILKIASITEQFTASLKTDHPIKFEFLLLEGGELLYFLAPRVEEPDFDSEEDNFMDELENEEE